MKSLFFLFALTSFAMAAVKPECEYWGNRIRDLDVSITIQKEELDACENDCRDIEELIGALEREKGVTKQFLEDPFYGCVAKK